MEVHGPMLLHTTTCTETRGAVPGHLLQVIQGPMITLSFLNYISETLWKFQANSFHRSFLEGKCQVSSQALIPTLTQSTCNAAAALQKCEQVEQWKLIGCMSCGK